MCGFIPFQNSNSIPAVAIQVPSVHTGACGLTRS